MTSVVPAAIDRLPRVGEAAVCMGVFDGVHRGHLLLVATTIQAARDRGLKSVALVFEPHPDEVVRPGTVVPRLAPLEENLRRLAAAGIDAPLAVRFDAELRARTPQEFLAAMAPAVRVRALVMTPESAFGKDRAGTPEAMAVHGREAGFDLVRAERIVEDDGVPISSARVRDSLRAGDLTAAGRLLGHAPYLQATLETARGASWSLNFEYPAALPGPGRYRAAVQRRENGGSPADAVLVVDDGAIGLEGWSGEATAGDVVALDVVERIS